MMDRNAYDDKKLARYDRYTNLADKAKTDSNAAYDASNKATAGIPFGQPILVGHHSEGAHRRAIAKAHSNMDKCVKLTDKANYYTDKAAGVLNNNAISSDDPDALKKLDDKLRDLAAKRTSIKLRPHESWELSNIGANIRRVKLRIALLKKNDTMKDSKKVINGITIKIDTDLNRVMLLFPGIPDKDIRTKLKSNGFRWSPYNNAWLRMISNHAIWLADDIAKDAGIKKDD